MTDAQLADSARGYLARLESALAGVDEATAAELVSGVREGLVGAGAEEAAARIRGLGDPDFIAAEARAALPAVAATTVAGEPVATGSTKREPVWFSVIAGLLVMLGGVVVPVLGVLAGYMMMWFSTVWTRRQKVIATAAPVALIVLLAAASGSMPMALMQLAPSDGFGYSAVAVNPLMPSGYDLLWSGAVLLALVQLAIGVWLLAVARRSRMRRG